jgi:hypothetical protein
VQLPYDKPLPLDLIAEIAKWCYETGITLEMKEAMWIQPGCFGGFACAEKILTGSGYLAYFFCFHFMPQEFSTQGI